MRSGLQYSKLSGCVCRFCRSRMGGHHPVTVAQTERERKRTSINAISVDGLMDAGVTRVMADAIEQARTERPFESIADACKRCD
eukprot:SAG31_NODE_2984_length_4824_cov_183.057143_5_plen_84_part_00